MPIVDMSFENGIFFAKEYGRVDKADAKLWAERLSHHCMISLVPVVAVIDALDVRYISTEARQIFVKTSKIPNFKLSAVAAKELATAQTARIIAMMSEENHCHVFASLSEAQHFALEHTMGAGAGR